MQIVYLMVNKRVIDKNNTEFSEFNVGEDGVLYIEEHQ